MATPTAKAPKPSTAGAVVGYIFAVLVPLIAGGVALYFIFKKAAKSTPPPLPPAPPPVVCTSNADCGAGTCTTATGVCDCPPGFSGPSCGYTVSAATQLGTRTSCTAAPRACTTDGDCVDCGNTNLQFACSNLNADQTTTGVAGKYCTPQKPASGCKDVPRGSKSADQIPGEFVWEGWRDSNTAAWSCACPFSYYPSDDASDGACRRASSLCLHGVWTYPLPGHKVGDAPSTAGGCACTGVPCSSDSDCAGKCGQPDAQGKRVCTAQRLGLSSTTGLPSCVKDTCAPNGAWEPSPTPTSPYGTCRCNPGYVNTGFACVKATDVQMREWMSAPNQAYLLSK